VNISGCLLIGVLMVVITELVTPHRLVRPFLGVGVLGGYTTFSTATVDALTLVDASRPGAALGYLVATPTLALLGCAAAVIAARLLAGLTASTDESRIVTAMSAIWVGVATRPSPSSRTAPGPPPWRTSPAASPPAAGGRARLVGNRNLLT
jgi:protein CrcB